jgi:hypothetical protein
MAGMKLSGTTEVLKNLNKAVRDIRFNTKKGLTESALVIKADSVRNTPIDFGNLRGSAFVMVTDWKFDNPHGDFKGDVDVVKMQADHSKSRAEMDKEVAGASYSYSAVVAYSASYAFYVHEMTGPVNWNAPNTGSQFLIKAVRKNQPRVLRILAKHARF